MTTRCIHIFCSTTLPPYKILRQIDVLRLPILWSSLIALAARPINFCMQLYGGGARRFSEIWP
jgi:hypothetical protein